MRIVRGKCSYFNGTLEGLKNAFVTLWNSASEEVQESITTFEPPADAAIQGPSDTQVQCPECDSVFEGISEQMHKRIIELEQDLAETTKMLDEKHEDCIRFSNKAAHLEQELTETKKKLVAKLENQNELLEAVEAANVRHVKIIDRLLA